MSYDAPNTTGLFAELLAGAEAVKERPSLIAERDKALSDVKFHQERLGQFREAHDTMSARIAELEAALATKEAELAQSTFREQEVGNKLQALVTSFKHVIGEVKSAADLASELVAEPEPVKEQAPVNTTPPAPTWETITITPDPIDNRYTAGPTEDSVRPFVDGTPTTSNDTWGTSQPHTGDTSHAALQPNDPFVAASPQEAPSTPAPTLPPFPAGGSADSSNIASGKEYWHKPTTMSREDWVASGGELAPWDKNEDLYIPY
jgi:hypothetical protein